MLYGSANRLFRLASDWVVTEVTIMKFEIEKLRKEASVSTDKEFDEKYPGIKRDAIRAMNDEELEKIVGGFLTKTYRTRTPAK